MSTEIVYRWQLTPSLLSLEDGTEMEMFVATAVLSGLLALVFTAGALGKLGMAKSEVDKAEKLQIRWERYRFIALPEAAAVIGLLVGLKVAPLGVAAAAGLVALMAGAMTFRARVHDAAPLLVGDGVILAIAGVTAALRVLTA